MAYTQDDIQALDDALATGALRVRHKDGEVWYRSQADLLAARRRIAVALGIEGDPADRIEFIQFRTTTGWHR